MADAVLPGGVAAGSAGHVCSVWAVPITDAASRSFSPIAVCARFLPSDGRHSGSWVCTWGGSSLFIHLQHVMEGSGPQHHLQGTSQCGPILLPSAGLVFRVTMLRLNSGTQHK